MKGLKAYTKKHGKHFTEKLAASATSGKWSPSEIMQEAQGMVYYNVTGSTVGDIVFLANYAKDTGKPFYRTKHNCVRFALCIIGEYALHDGVMFSKWVGDSRDFDLTPYI